MSSVVAGFFGLMLLSAMVASPTAANRAGGFLTGAAGVVSRFVDPTVPLIGARGVPSSPVGPGPGPVISIPGTGITVPFPAPVKSA